MREMAGLVRLAKRTDPRFRILVQHITRDCPGKAWMTEIRCIFNYVRDNIRYMLDTNDVEVLQSPEFTLEVGSGDCDDFCILLATMLEVCGHPCRFIAVGFQQDFGGLSHVLTQTRAAGDGGWISLDATEKFPMGWFPPDVTTTMVQDI